mmetsp:Transcript_36885/g.82627  ORF Transcript_36885/g.82627 Transcript_36885/m.82627 type:complete len:222 (-) Transcript_36885:1532-2197(-)
MVGRWEASEYRGGRGFSEIGFEAVCWVGGAGVSSGRGWVEGQGLPSHSKHVVSLAWSSGPSRVMRSWVRDWRYFRVCVVLGWGHVWRACWRESSVPVQAVVSKQWGHWDLFGPHRSRIAASIFPCLSVLALEYNSDMLEQWSRPKRMRAVLCLASVVSCLKADSEAAASTSPCSRARAVVPWCFGRPRRRARRSCVCLAAMTVLISFVILIPPVTKVAVGP